MAYKLGKRSRERLEWVHPDLVRVIERAIEITEVDFTVLEGLRTLKRQKRLVKTGKSKTLKSRHLTGHAVDLGAYVSGRVQWDWPLYFKIAKAVQQAANELNIRIQWGGSWTVINEEKDLEAAMKRYVERKKKEGKKPLADGPHFQLPWFYYPVSVQGVA